MYSFMEMGGMFMWPVMIFGLATLGAACRYAFLPDTTRARQTIALGILTVMAGLAGTSLGFVITLTSMARVAPDERFIAMIGVGESLCNAALAFTLVSFAALVAAVGTWRLPSGGGAPARVPALN